MAGDGPRHDAGKQGESEIGAAEFLFRGDPAGKAASPGGSGPPLAGRSGGGETFDLADSPYDEAGTADPPAPPVPATAPPVARPRESARPKSDRAGEAYPIDPEALVDVVWSRGAEWGPNLVVVGAWLLAVALACYLMSGWHLGIAFLMLLIGGAVAVVLSYPILITLERPVRMTPEQAVKDYYGALSHHVPHYRRMWLLLARTGRICSSYGSFEGFKAYWKEKVATIKGSQAGPMTPLVFEVESFRGDKSAGKSQVEARFTLRIFVRGRREAGPIASIPGEISLVRGPDKMWYLESGTLPHARRADNAD